VKVAGGGSTLHIDFVQILSDVINDLAGWAVQSNQLFGARPRKTRGVRHEHRAKLTAVSGLVDLFNGR